MSALWRKRKGIIYAQGYPEVMPQADDTDVIEGYLTYDPLASDLNLAQPIGTDDILISVTPTITGPREVWHPADFNDGPWSESAVPTVENIRDNIDWETGGQHGIRDFNAYALFGPVTSESVEDFSMRGEQAIIRREQSPHMPGDVGTSDSSAMLAIAYAQAVSQYWPNEASEGDLVRSV